MWQLTSSANHVVSSFSVGWLDTRSQRTSSMFDNDNFADFQLPKPKKWKVAATGSRFAEPTFSSTMASISKGFVPANTAKANNWARCVFEEWRTYRNQLSDTETCPSNLLEKILNCPLWTTGCPVLSSKLAEKMVILTQPQQLWTCWIHRRGKNSSESRLGQFYDWLEQSLITYWPHFVVRR